MASQATGQSTGASGAQSTAATSGSSGGTLPQDAQAIIAMLRELGVSEFEPRVVSQLLDFAYGYVRDVLGEARSLANHSGHKQVDIDDVRQAVQFCSEKSFSTPLPAPGVIAEIAATRNSQPLPPPRQTGKAVAGVRLPPDRHCLTQAAFQLRSQELPLQQPPQPSQQRYIAASQPATGHPAATAADHRMYSSGTNAVPSRPSSSFSANQHMLTDYDL